LQEASLPDPKLDNLKRWSESGQAEQWVDAHGGQWSYSDWVAYLDELKAGPFWPMTPDDIGAQLEALAKQFRQKRGQIVVLSNYAPPSDALWWYVGGLAVVGLTSGFFAGASHTPIVGTLLPLLFALIGGTSSIYLATADLSTPETAARLRWLGQALGVFGLACLVGSASGIALRLHYAQPTRHELISLWHGNTQEAIQLAALRTKLQLLGLAPNEQSVVLAAAGLALDDARRPIPPVHVREVAAEAAQLQSELKALRDKTAASGGHIPEDAEALVTELDLFRHQTEPWVDAGMPRDLYKNSVETVWFHMSHIAMPHDVATAAWIHQTGFDTKNLYKFFASLHAEFELRDDLDWEMGGAAADKLDKFLQWMTKSAKPSKDSEELLPSIDSPAPKAETKPDEKKDEKKP
jgi:hypothetical protein